MSGCRGLGYSCAKCIVCLSERASNIKNSAHDETIFLGGGGDTACGTYII